MKRIIVMGVILFFIFMGSVSAETFNEGSFITGEYINKVKDGRTYYMTVQYILDNNGDFVYCLEPFVDFQAGSNYEKHSSNFASLLNLSESQVRRIQLIGYYGYKYRGRDSSKWYVISQYMIWKTVDPNANIYFTDKLNGNKIDKYVSEMNEIENDIKKMEGSFSFSNNITIPYKENGELIDTNNVLNNYVVDSSDYDYLLESNKLIVKNVQKKGKVQLIQDYSGNTNNNPYIYLHPSSQKLYKVGKPEEKSVVLNIQMIAGTLVLDIQGDDSVYSAQSKFGTTCYGLYNEKNEVVKLLYVNNPIKHTFNKLELGKYYIKQQSIGVGYKLDPNVYSVELTKDHLEETLTLKNIMIKNDIVINKSYCKNDNCLVEEGAKFNVFDINNDLVKEIVTDEDGIASIRLGYGSYKLRQTTGLDGYSLAEDFETKIENEEDKLLFNINNNYIEKETKVASVVEVIEEKENEIKPPETRVDSFFVKIKWVSWRVVSYVKSLLKW